jgi:hypothetical protein
VVSDEVVEVVSSVVEEEPGVNVGISFKDEDDTVGSVMLLSSPGAGVGSARRVTHSPLESKQKLVVEVVVEDESGVTTGMTSKDDDDDTVGSVNVGSPSVIVPFSEVVEG